MKKRSQIYLFYIIQVNIIPIIYYWAVFTESKIVLQKTHIPSRFDYILS